jgi:hypothetical protein
MKLKTGLLGKSLGWEILLAQIGVGFDRISSISEINDYLILVIADEYDNEIDPALRKYLQEGGGLLCSSFIFDMIANTHSKEVFLKYLSPDKDGLFTDPEIIDIYKKVKISTQANHLRTNEGEFSTFCGRYLNGNVVVLPFDIGSLIVDERSREKSFYSKSKRLPYEEVSLVSKGSIRRIVTRALENLFHSAQLPFVHLWFYPKDVSNVFIFRADTDYGTIHQIDQLYHLSQKYNIPTTWFVDTKSQQSWINYFSEMQNQEIGVHCYEHRNYNSYAENYSNIKKAYDLLKDAGIGPRGFAAPFGKWNPTLAQAVRDIGFSYSSEFSYDYDNLPSRSIIYSGLTGTLQIPVHPICIGSLRRQGFTRIEMTEYFINEIEKKLKMREPIVLYHHPTHENLDVVENVFRKIKDLNVPTMKMYEYADWWKKRATVQYGESVLEDVYAQIINPDGKEKIIFINDGVTMNDFGWKVKPINVPLPDGIARIRKFNKWMLIHKLENFLHRKK